MISAEAGVSIAGDVPTEVWLAPVCQAWGQALSTRWLVSHLIFVLAA